MTRSSNPTNGAPRIALVRRLDIPATTAPSQAGREDRPFVAHPILAQFLESAGAVDFTWSRVASSQRAAIDSHPERRLLIVVAGSAELVGARRARVKEGDVIALPAESSHVFEAVAESGLHFLTLTFRGGGRSQVREIVSLEGLLGRNDERAAVFLRNPFFDLLRDDTLRDPERLSVFRPTVRVFSDAFQTLLFTREATCCDAAFRSTFSHHFREEAGHNELLGDRDRDEPVRDPRLTALLSWFTYQMLVLDNVEKAVLVHLVLETAGHHFETLGSANAWLRNDAAAAYFKAHAADDRHKDMVTGLLEGLHPRTYRRLGRLLDDGWDVLEQITKRMAAVIRGDAKSAASC